MKKELMTTVLLVLGFVFFGGLLRAEENDQDNKWTPKYMVENFKRVGGTAISPDGEWVAFTVSEARTQGEYSDYLTHVHLVKTDGSRQFQLTRGDVSAGNPRWSPDGGLISFTSSRAGDGNQLWLIDPSGGEAWQLTAAEGSVSQYKWSNSGSHIAFTMVDPPCEEQKRRQKEKEDVNVVDADLSYSHLYVVEVGQGSHEPSEMIRITEGEFHIGQFDWSPDDKTLVFDHQSRPGLEYHVHTNISTVPVDGGEVELLIDLGARDASPVYSPCGGYVAFTTDQGNHRWPGYLIIKVLDLSDGSMMRLGETFDDEPRNIEWSPDGDEIFYMELHKTSIDLFAMPVTGEDAQYRQITQGAGRFSGFSITADGSRMAAIHQDFNVAPDVIVSDMDVFSPAYLTNINEGYELTAIANARVITYESKDGMIIEAPLIYPVDYQEGQRYPVLLHVHGGPTGVFGESYVGNPSVYPLQVFAAEGYFVLQPNFRGSGGYGKDFRFANLSDWGYGDLEDMKAGLDKLIEEGLVDPDKQAIMGWSYGGYMSSFAITQTDRFKASMVGAGVTNLISMTGTSDIPSFLPDYFESEYWENYERHMRHSAIFNVANITTPTLILHPEQDIRVPPSQGFELYVALKRLGVETKMVTYPRQPHGIREPKFTIDAADRQLRWLDRYM